MMFASGHQARIRGPLTLLVLLAVVAVAFYALGSAASLQLNVTNAPLWNVGTAQRCTEGSVTMSPSGEPTGGKYTQVKVTDIEGCDYGNASLYLGSPPHQVVMSGSAVAAGGELLMTVPAFTAPQTDDAVAVVALNGWLVPATWEHETTVTPPAPTALKCSLVGAPGYTCWLVLKKYEWSGDQVHLEFDVRTDSPSLAQWEIELNIAQTEYAHGLEDASHPTLFPGYPVPAGEWWTQWTPTRFSHYNLCSVNTNAQLPTITLRGAHDWNSRVSASQPAGNAGIIYSRHSGDPLGTSSAYGESPSC